MGIFIVCSGRPCYNEKYQIAPDLGRRLKCRYFFVRIKVYQKGRKGRQVIMCEKNLYMGKRVWRVFLLAVLLCFCLPLPIQAAESTGSGVKKEAQYYYKKGVRQKGWQKIKGKYYYFNRKSGIKVEGETVDGIEIKKDGTAVKSSYNKRKIETMITAHKLVNKITKSTDSRAVKRKKCFKWMFRFPYRLPREFDKAKKKKGWEMTFANDIFVDAGGDCVSESAALAFLFHECGYEDVYICHDSEHAWVETVDRVFDPLFAEARKYSRYYNVTYKAYYAECTRYGKARRVKLRKNQFKHVGRCKI
ncbi:MAG TPA: hypothetical protein DF613_13620 [Lachnospiraceae bacterium]|nr:hypothetical protein [Lachnospiraceae bacterium]